MSAPADMGVSEAAAALAGGTVSALELAEACLERLEGPRGRALNAFIHVAGELARDQARESDRRRAAGSPRSPLDGVPIAMKDNIDVRGMPTTNGLATSWIPGSDAPVVRRLREAGMTFLGKLNMHEGALGATTDNPHHGRCMHPALPGFTPGGSSGGSAAAVAGGLCPVALGTDTMGSVRLPAAYCGIVGFKPSAEYWPVTGVMPLAFGLDTVGALAGRVADIALLLGETLDGPVLGRLRFARLANSDAIDIEPECRAAFDRALARMASAGIDIECVQVDGYDPGACRRAGFVVAETDAAVAHAELLSTVPGAFSPAFRAMLAYGATVSPERYSRERETIERAGAALRAVLDRFDVVITPATPQRAFRFEDPVPANQADFTAIANFAGCPAVSIPLPPPGDGRPVGLQLLAAPGRDSTLLSVASALEAACGPAPRPRSGQAPARGSSLSTSFDQ